MDRLLQSGFGPPAWRSFSINPNYSYFLCFSFLIFFWVQCVFCSVSMLPPVLIFWVKTIVSGCTWLYSQLLWLTRVQFQILCIPPNSIQTSSLHNSTYTHPLHPCPTLDCSVSHQSQKYGDISAFKVQFPKEIQGQADSKINLLHVSSWLCFISISTASAPPGCVSLRPEAGL